MPIAFNCDQCARLIRVADHLAGRRIRCPGCQQAVTVPAQEEEILDVEVEIVPEPPVRRARRPFDEESRRKAPPEPAPRALTLNNDTRASNPGRIKVQFFKYWSCFPTWPTLGSLSVLIFLAVGIVFKAVLTFAVFSGVLLVMYWIRVREHFTHGCALPGIVLSVEKELVAFCTDLSTGSGEYPAVLILRQPLSKMAGGPPRKNQRVVGVAVYEPSPTQNDHWATFHPKLINCVTADLAAIQECFNSIDDENWQELTAYLERIPRKTEGLHTLW